jgi:hypothetical protein
MLMAFPEKESNPDITTDTRAIRLNDPYNAISNIIMLEAVLEPTPERPNGRFHPSGICNFDAMSVVIGTPAKSQTIRMVLGTKEAMRRLGRSSSRVAKPGERKRRSVKLTLAGVATGQTTSAIHTSKQRTCKKMEYIKLPDLTQGCNHYFVITPARPRKEELIDILRIEESLAQVPVLADEGGDLLNDEVSSEQDGGSNFDEDEDEFPRCKASLTLA